MATAQTATETKPTAKVKEPKSNTPAAAADGQKTPGAGRPRLPKFPDDHVVTVFKPGSKARGAAQRFNRYVTGMTVKAYVDKIREEFGRTDGQTYADMRWDMEHKFIHIGPTTVPIPVEPVPPPAPPKAATAAPAQAKA